MLAWHFSSSENTLRYGDGRKIVAGETLTVAGPIKLCERGLHASAILCYALAQAPGLSLWRVELSGTLIKDAPYKAVASERKALWNLDADKTKKIVTVWVRRVALYGLENYWDEAELGKKPPLLMEFLLSGDKGIAAEIAKAATANTYIKSPGTIWNVRASWAAAIATARDKDDEVATWASYGCNWATWAAGGLVNALRSTALQKYNQWLEEMVIAELERS